MQPDHGSMWRYQMRENGHKCPQRELLREQRRLESKTQRRLCSMAKRVAAVRELTPSLW